MFQKKRVIFRKHTILKAQMLEASCNVPVELLELMYHGWADGIVSGAEVVVQENNICVTPGILLKDGRLYHMTQAQVIPYEANEEEMMLRIHFDERKENETGIFYGTDFILTSEPDIRNCDMELARFCLKTGAILRDDYKDFSDLCTKYNTINVLYAPYAEYKKATLSTRITEKFAKEARKCTGLEDCDIAFLMECMKGKAVNLELIEIYIERKLGIKLQNELSREEIFQKLQLILQKLKAPSHRGKAIAERKIMIE